jgi:hypothetical protein
MLKVPESPGSVSAACIELENTVVYKDPATELAFRTSLIVQELGLKVYGWNFECKIDVSGCDDRKMWLMCA